MRALATVALTALMAACSEPAEPPWTSSSQRISIQSFGVWQGLSGYERPRAELTAAQLALLDALEVREPNASCGTDQLGYDITIVDGTGVTHVYHATQWDQDCDETAAFIAMASLQPFLATFACISSRDTRPDAQVMHPGDGCRHGFYMDGQGTSVRATLAVEGAGELTIAAEAAAEFVPQLRLFDTDGTTVLGSGADALTYVFPEAGSYFVEVSSSSAQHGDLLLRVE